MFWPPHYPPLPPDSTHQWQAPMAPIQSMADVRAKAYELARAELPGGIDRTSLIEAAEEIFQWLYYGTAPLPKAS